LRSAAFNLAARHAIPSSFSVRDNVEAGGQRRLKASRNIGLSETVSARAH
jgi:hypothetical protein